MTLSEFLLSRYAEEEAVARTTIEGFDPLDWSEKIDAEAWAMAGPVDGPSGYGSLIVDPARVMAECEAHRQVLAIHSNAASWQPGYCAVCNDDAGAAEAYPCPTLRTLAMVYADHPDFQEAWRV